MLLRVALPPQRALVECFPLLLLPFACFGHGHPRVLVFDGHMHSWFRSMGLCSLRCCCACVGAGLGVFDPDRVRELGLPTLPSAPVAVEQGTAGSSSVAVTPADPSKSVSEDATKGPRKSMLGVNSPVVPSRIVKWILSADFGDMAELSNENLESEKRRSGEGEDTKSTPRGHGAGGVSSHDLARARYM